jgi:hypothetical protein
MLVTRSGMGRLALRRCFVTAASTDNEEPIRHPVPPFTEETAKQKVKAAQVCHGPAPCP